MEPANPNAHYMQCKTLLSKYNRNIRIRCIVMAVLLVCGIYVKAYDFSLMTMLHTILASIVLLAAAFCQSLKRLWLYIALLAAILIGAVTDVLSGLGYVELVMFLTAIPEYKKFAWIREQPGYPHFSERFDEQNAHREYEPEHHAVPTAQETILPAQDVPDAPEAMPPVEMPGIDEFPE